MPRTPPLDHTPPRRAQAILEISASEGLLLEQFQEAELLVNITEHVLVPLHVVLSKEEKQVVR